MHGSIVKAALLLSVGMMASSCILVAGMFVTIVGIQMMEQNNCSPNMMASNVPVPTMLPANYPTPPTLQPVSGPMTPPPCYGVPVPQPINGPAPQ
jgi:hypothetical protein